MRHQPCCATVWAIDLKSGVGVGVDAEVGVPAASACGLPAASQAKSPGHVRRLLAQHAPNGRIPFADHPLAVEHRNAVTMDLFEHQPETATLASQFAFLVHGGRDVFDRHHRATRVGPHHLQHQMQRVALGPYRGAALRCHHWPDGSRRGTPAITQARHQGIEYGGAVGPAAVDVEILQHLHGLGVEHLHRTAFAEADDGHGRQIDELQQFLDLALQTGNGHVHRTRRYMGPSPAGLTRRKVTGTGLMRRAKVYSSVSSSTGSS